MRCPTISLERILFGLAGTMTLVAVAVGVTVSPWALLLAALVGANQWLYAAVGGCPASAVLRRTPCYAREVSR
jgi:Inner membrane protein YgaP-like, transmembrane domain